MRAIVLVEMGGALDVKGYKQFLTNMFSDKHIIPAPPFVRFFLSRYIPFKRLKKGWKNYQAIGKTPIFDSVEAMRSKLQNLYPNDIVTTAFSYTTPTIRESVEKLIDKGVDQFTFLSYYPHKSYTTTESVRDDIEKIFNNRKDINYKILDNYSDNSHFINFWNRMITDEIDSSGMSRPHLIFSAHSIPKSIVNKFNDPYPDRVKLSAKLIANSLNLRYNISYQSQIDKDSWLGPSTEDCIDKLISEGEDQFIIIPISFLNENLETRYDLDIKLIPLFKSRGVKIERAKIVYGDESIKNMFMEFIDEDLR